MLSAYAYCYAKLTRDLAGLAGKVATIGRTFCEQPAEDLISDAELGRITEHALEWARSGSKITNRKLAAFAGLDPVADRERIERLGLNLATGPKGRNERTRERRDDRRGKFSRRRSIAGRSAERSEARAGACISWLGNRAIDRACAPGGVLGGAPARERPVFGLGVALECTGRSGARRVRPLWAKNFSPAATGVQALKRAIGSLERHPSPL
jgi:hypothetical protein